MVEFASRLSKSSCQRSRIYQNKDDPGGATNRNAVFLALCRRVLAGGLLRLGRT